MKKQNTIQTQNNKTNPKQNTIENNKLLRGKAGYGQHTSP